MNSLPLLNNSLVKKIRRPLGRLRRWLRARPVRTRRQRETLLQDPTLPPLDRVLLEKVETRISPNDGMYRGDGNHYFRVGLSAIHCIENALKPARIDEIRNALDMPCGHGRVLRFLVHQYPQTHFTACDLDRNGVDFCAKIFGATPLYSQPKLRDLSLASSFDLIWCGSLITHLDENKIPELLAFFSRYLAPGGLVVFTAAGERVAQWMATGEFDYGIDRRKIPVIANTYQQHGYAYTDYPYMPDYGISLTSPDWIRSLIEKVGSLREVYFQPHGWDDHQDVYGFVKVS